MIHGDLAMLNICDKARHLSRRVVPCVLVGSDVVSRRVMCG